MEENKVIPVSENDPKLVYAIAAKVAPPVPWWQANFGGIVIVVLCVMGIILLGES